MARHVPIGVAVNVEVGAVDVDGIVVVARGIWEEMQEQTREIALEARTFSTEGVAIGDMPLALRVAVEVVVTGGLVWVM